MTEEFWAQYKKKKDATQTNQLWRNVCIIYPTLRNEFDLMILDQ